MPIASSEQELLAEPLTNFKDQQTAKPTATKTVPVITVPVNSPIIRKSWHIQHPKFKPLDPSFKPSLGSGVWTPEFLRPQPLSRPNARSASKGAKTKYERIQNAVATAVLNYRSWYEAYHGVGETKNDESNAGHSVSRGKTGFFTWFRHGKKGQENAGNLLKRVNDCKVNPDKAGEAIKIINEELLQAKTRYATHSFASFLLDQLSLIKDTPWYQLAFKDRNRDHERHYSKAMLEARIDAYHPKL